jgi:hypothetical protein
VESLETGKLIEKYSSSPRLTGVFLGAAFFEAALGFGAGAGTASSELALSAEDSLALPVRFAATLAFAVGAFFAAAFFGGISVQMRKSDSYS